MTYSLDFRRKVLSIKTKEGLSFAQTSKRFEVSVNSLFLWSKRLEPQRTRNKSASKIDMDALKKDVELYPDGYIYERAERLRVSRTCIWNALKRLGVTYKKNSKTSQGRSRKTFCFLPSD